jgi:hypothetical protein
LHVSFSAPKRFKKVDGSVAKFDFWGKIPKSGTRNSMTYRLPDSRKSNFATEPYKVGQKPVSAELIDTVIARDIDDLEPRLTRQGYHMKALAELLSAKPAEIRLFLRGQLATGRTQELHSGLLAAGISL